MRIYLRNRPLNRFFFSWLGLFKLRSGIRPNPALETSRHIERHDRPKLPRRVISGEVRKAVSTLLHSVSQYFWMDQALTQILCRLHDALLNSVAPSAQGTTARIGSLVLARIQQIKQTSKRPVYHERQSTI